jgi:excisionase family DNA binding protein
MATTTPDDVLTLFEAAKLLQVSEKTLANQAKAGQVPHCRIGKQFRFVRGELLAWARSTTAAKPKSDAEFNAELSAIVTRSMAQQR